KLRFIDAKKKSVKIPFYKFHFYKNDIKFIISIHHIFIILENNCCQANSLYYILAFIGFIKYLVAEAIYHPISK
ncbi:MAG: hypothetical protein QOK71_08675, partial [Nitrososphaeraceae archaeon]|nr:hypothetical protein [Nitrososphaeraceae archaeon]